MRWALIMLVAWGLAGCELFENAQCAACTGSCPDGLICRDGFCTVEGEPGCVQVTPTPFPSDPPGDPRLSNVAFVTSRKYVMGELGGLQGADAICMEHAEAASLDGEFRAWLSAPGVDARDRFSGASGWRRVDGRPFADTRNSLLRGRIYYPLYINELGGDTREPRANADGGLDFLDVAASGTDERGREVSGWTCDGWRSLEGSAVLGTPSGGTDIWTNLRTEGCEVSAYLYCLGVAHLGRAVPETSQGRIAFQSSAWLEGAVEAGVADSTCMQEAAEAGLTGSFFAYRASAGRAASDLIPAGAAYWRPDGVEVGSRELLTGVSQLIAPINVSADARLYLGRSRVWTGAEDPSLPGELEATCSNWREEGRGGRVGFGASTREWFAMDELVECTGTALPVYCLQR